MGGLLVGRALPTRSRRCAPVELEPGGSRTLRVPPRRHRVGRRRTADRLPVRGGGESAAPWRRCRGHPGKRASRPPHPDARALAQHAGQRLGCASGDLRHRPLGGYYQQSGAYGFRDQLQDAQVWLTIEPQKCRGRSTCTPPTSSRTGPSTTGGTRSPEQGHITRMTDDLLWLALCHGQLHQGDGRPRASWTRPAPFIDDQQPAAAAASTSRAVTFSPAHQPASLPYIGAGDWNDGLSAVGCRNTASRSGWRISSSVCSRIGRRFTGASRRAQAAEFERRRTALDRGRQPARVGRRVVHPRPRSTTGPNSAATRTASGGFSSTRRPGPCSTMSPRPSGRTSAWPRLREHLVCAARRSSSSHPRSTARSRDRLHHALRTGLRRMAASTRTPQRGRSPPRAKCTTTNRSAGC